MTNTIGSLFSVFDSRISINNAEITSSLSSQLFIYLSNSQAVLSNSYISDMAFDDVGGFATLLGNSDFSLTKVTFINMTSSEHGVISLKKSSLTVFASQFRDFNMSLIVAQQSVVTIIDTEIRDGHIPIVNKSLSMIPNGGVVSCVDCREVVISQCKVSQVSAKEGGVVYGISTDVSLPGIITIENSSFEHCSATTIGGVVSTHACSLAIRNCTFERNSATSGGVVNYEAESQQSSVDNSSFRFNTARLDGACVRWVGSRPSMSDITQANNSAIYGNPEASVANHFQILDSSTYEPVGTFPVLGVTGQQMETPLVVGVFDEIGQLISTDNSTLVTLTVPSGLECSGSTEVLSQGGIAEFSLLFTPYSTDTVNLTFSSEDSAIEELTIRYAFRTCNPGEIRSAGGCFACQKNSYSFSPADSACKVCPAHAECFGRTDLRVDSGYWRAGNLSEDIYACLSEDACDGGLDSDCGAGYVGVLCGSCSKGFYRFGIWECQDCDRELHGAIRGIIIGIMLLVGVGVPPLLFLNRDGGWFRVAMGFKVVMNYTQMMMFVVMLQVKWPFSTLVHHEVMRAIASLGNIFIYSGCEYDSLDVPAFHFRLVMTAFYPVLLILASAFLSIIVSLCRKLTCKEGVVTFVSYTCVAIYNFVPLLSLVTMSMYKCMEVAGRNWLVVDMIVECWKETHMAYVRKVTIPLMIFIVFSQMFAVIVIKRELKGAVFKDLSQYLTSGFTPQSKSWEICIMVRKATLLLITLSFPKLDRFSTVLVYSIIIGLSLQIDIKRQPYCSKSLNCLNIASLVSLFAIIFTAANGSEPVLTSVSCCGSMAVLAVDCVALRVMERERGKVYEVPDNQSRGESKAIAQRSHNSSPIDNESYEGGMLQPPPSVADDTRPVVVSFE